MRKDPTEFRKRFAAWKNGEKVYKDGLPVYYKGKTPWGDTEEQEAVKEWAEDWKTRTTAAGSSKVLQRWNATGSKPKPESSLEYTKRRVAEETKMTPVTRAVGKVMDIPTVANATPGTSTGYAAFGLNMPQQQSTVGNEIGAFLDAAFAPQMPGDIVKAYNFVRNVPKKYIAPWMISREMKKALNKTELDIPQRYILKNYSFGDDGTISSTTYDLVDALFGTRLGDGVVFGRLMGCKGRPVGWIESQNKAHGVTEDVYNVAVEDALRLGELGVESGWDLMSPEKTLNVTKKFPHEVIGESKGNPVRLLTNTTNKLKPRYINSSNHNVFKNNDNIVFNEKTGEFELKDNTADVPSVFDLYNKVKPYSKLLQKSLNDVNNTFDIAKEPYIKTSADIAKESSTIRELNRVNEMLRKFSDDDSRISNAYNNIKTFLQSPAYKKRLEKYYRDKGSSIITQNVAPGDRIGEQLYNIETSKLKLMPKGKLIDEVGNVKDSFGLYDPNSHSIQIASDAIFRLTPEHEMWHAARKGMPYLDNAKYSMQTKALREIDDMFEKAFPPGKFDSKRIKQLEEDAWYYSQIPELEVRVLDTLREMQEAGLDINKLTDDQIWNFLKDTPIDTHGTNVQSLIDNYWYDDIKNALRNFKTVIYPLGFGGVGYGSYNKYAE